MNITAEDISRAQEILRRWHTMAFGKSNTEAMADVKHLMRVLSQLYAGGAD